jgi:alpha-L-rhamnosidase
MAARSEEAVYNFDLARLLPKWMNDISDAQDASGAITDTAPYRWGNRPADPVSVCYLLIPWLLYVHYGDRRTMDVHYDGMRRWVDFLTTQSTDHIVQYSYWGDWAPPIEEGVQGSIGSSAVARNTPGQLISTAHYYYSALLFSRIAGVLGREKDAAKYGTLARDICRAFNDCYWDEQAGGYGTNNQACNSVALYMGMVPEERRQSTLANLVRDVEAHDYHLSTGNLCSKYILEVLRAEGYGDVAFRLVTQTTYPSWGYMLANGATTIWERWEKMSGRGMNSHNHPMYASVGAWLYRNLGGIQAVPDAPGLARFAIRPFIPSDMKSAHASLKTIRGTVESTWRLHDGSVQLSLTLPGGTSAEVRIPFPKTSGIMQVRENGTTIWAGGTRQETVPGVEDIRVESNAVVLEVGAGTYAFAVRGAC